MLDGWVGKETHTYVTKWGTPTTAGNAHRVIVERESEWDDEQRELVLAWLEHERLTDRCGHHPETGMDPNVMRMVEHVSMKCLDCEAIAEAPAKWHRLEEHSGSVADCLICRDLGFYIDEHVPI